MNIVIPMAGRGARFTSVGYDLPKPLLEIKGRPLIEYVIESLNIEGNYIFIVQSDHIEHFQIDEILQRIKPGSIVIPVNHVTNGPACSALLAKPYIHNDEELVIANCDQIMKWWGAAFVNTARLYDGCIVTYTESSPKNSYARIDSKGFVLETDEKRVLSNISLNGIHYWKHGEYFVSSAEEMISAGDMVNHEFYISKTYNYMIRRGLRVGLHHIPTQQHQNVGVPEDFEAYMSGVCS